MVFSDDDLATIKNLAEAAAIKYAAPAKEHGMSESEVPKHTLIGGPENVKLMFDTFLGLVSQSVADNQRDARGYSDLNLRRAQNAASFDHAVNMGSVLAAQAGVTEQQSQVSPIRTGAGDAEVQQPAGAVYPPIRNVDQAGAIATGGIQTAMQAVADAVANLQNLLVAVEAAKAQDAAK